MPRSNTLIKICGLTSEEQALQVAKLGAHAIGIIVKAQHYCMKWRGVKEPNTSMINSVVRGDFRHDLSLKQEFFELVKQQSATNNY